MKITGNYHIEENNKYPKKKAFLLTATTIILILTITTSGIVNGSLQLVFAQEDISETLWSIPENVTLGVPIPGEKIITFENGSLPETAISALADEAENADGIEVEELRNVGAIIISNASEETTQQLADVIEENDTGILIEDSYPVTIDIQSLPTGINRIDGEPSVNTTSISESSTTTPANNTENNSVNATIGIIDTGIDLDHPELNVIDNVSFIAASPTGDDVRGHGTHVAGIAAAKDNDMGVVGVAPGAKLVSIKVLGDDGRGSTASILRGLEYALANAQKFDVVNLSLGQRGVSKAINNAVANLVAAGVPVVVTAGNTNSSAGYRSPASAAEAITVSATYDGDGKCGGIGPATNWQGEIIEDDSFAPYSNHGDVVDIEAPGTRINSTYPGGGFAIFSGTSMAAPHVTGAVALYKSIFPGADPSEVEDALNSMAVYVGDLCEITANNGQGYIEDWARDDDDGEEPHLYIGSLIDTQ